MDVIGIPFTSRKAALENRDASFKTWTMFDGLHLSLWSVRFKHIPIQNVRKLRKVHSNVAETIRRSMILHSNSSQNSISSATSPVDCNPSYEPGSSLQIRFAWTVYLLLLRSHVKLKFTTQLHPSDDETPASVVGRLSAVIGFDDDDVRHYRRYTDTTGFGWKL